MEEKTFEELNLFGKGEENTAYAKYFIGKSYLNPLTSAGVKPFFANVTFEPSCRNNWHIHKAKSGGGYIVRKGTVRLCRSCGNRTGRRLRPRLTEVSQTHTQNSFPRAVRREYCKRYNYML